MTVYVRFFSILGILTLMSLPMYGQVEEATSPEVEEEFASEEGEVSDTVEVKLRNRKYVIITDDEGRRIEIKDNSEGEEGDFDWDEFEEEFASDFDEEAKEKDSRQTYEVDLLGFDLGITNYYVDGVYGPNAASADLALREFRPGSHVALHIFPTRVSLIGKGAVNLKTALTIDWNNYYFTEDITLGQDQEQLTITRDGTLFSKNKLTARYFQVPLLLSFNTKPGSDNGIRIGIGGYAGLLWSSRTKQVSTEQGTIKLKGDYGVNPYRYGLTARFDFSWLDLYLNYNLSTLFEENSGGPQTQTFTAGLNIIHF